MVAQLQTTTGKIEYHSGLSSYAISIGVTGTYDCLITFLLCDGDFSSKAGKTVVVSGTIIEYTGDFQPGLAGERIFVLKGITFQID